MNKFAADKGGEPAGKVAGLDRRHRKFNWDYLLNGEEHEVVAGKDFWTETRVFQTQVTQMAKSRGVKVETSTKREPRAGKRAPKRIVVVKAILESEAPESRETGA